VVNKEQERLKEIAKERFLQGKTVEEIVNETGLTKRQVYGDQS